MVLGNHYSQCNEQSFPSCDEVVFKIEMIPLTQKSFYFAPFFSLQIVCLEIYYNEAVYHEQLPTYW